MPRCPRTVEGPCGCLAQADVGPSPKKSPCEAPLARGWLGKSGPCPQGFWGAGGNFEGSQTQNPRSTSVFKGNLIKCNTILTLSSWHHPPAGRNGTLQYISRFLSKTGQESHLQRVASSNHARANTKTETATATWRRHDGHFFLPSAAGRPSPSVTVSLPNAAMMCELLSGVLPHLPSPFRTLVTSRRCRLGLGVEMDFVILHAYVSTLP